MSERTTDDIALVYYTLAQLTTLGLFMAEQNSTSRVKPIILAGVAIGVGNQVLPLLDTLEGDS